MEPDYNRHISASLIDIKLLILRKHLLKHFWFFPWHLFSCCPQTFLKSLLFSRDQKSNRGARKMNLFTTMVQLWSYDSRNLCSKKRFIFRAPLWSLLKTDDFMYKNQFCKIFIWNSKLNYTSVKISVWIKERCRPRRCLQAYGGSSSTWCLSSCGPI